MHKLTSTVFPDLNELACTDCKSTLDFDFSFAFQPIINVLDKTIFAYEALVRGVNGEGASEILSLVTDQNRYKFDQECRKRSIFLAKKLNLKAKLSINFLPNAIYKPELCIKSTVAAAELADFPLHQIIFEVTEEENVLEPKKLISVFKYYKEKGFLTAIDDFGAGYAGLGLLVEFQPDFIKIDIKLVRDIHHNEIKQAIVRGIILTSKALGITLLAEGIESLEEARWFYNEGVHLMQGFYFAKPEFESLPTVHNWNL